MDSVAYIQIFDGDGWYEPLFMSKITGTGQITPVDGPIDWVGGFMNTPF